MTADILLRNGRVFDPGIGMDKIANVAIRDARITSLDAPPGAVARTDIDATGCWVVPGLIDVHTHCYWRGNYIGMPADIAGIPSGVTATIDAGSSGVSNYRGLLRVLDQCETRTKIMVHLSAGGQVMSSQYAENIDPSVWNPALFEKAFREFPDRIVGLKIRASKPVLGDLGLMPVHEGLKMAERLGTRLFVHPTNPIVPMAELAALLRPGDVMCHMYHGFGHTIIVDGKVDRGVLEARERGVIFDVSQGQGNFSIEVAKTAVAQGFLPDTISTDLNIENWNNPLDFSLPMVMTKHMALGMDFGDVIRAVTVNAAKQVGAQGELGTLAEGTVADVTVFKTTEHNIDYRDIHGNTLRGDTIIAPMATIINGQVLYRSPFTI